MFGDFFNIKKINFFRQVSIAPLVTFRIVFGMLMLLSLLRFWLKGWVSTVYILPKFHFTYWGFEWVHAFGATGMYLVFALMILSTLFIILGLFYRLSSIIFFLCFTYIELIDVTTYLNHYYFISLIAFILIWLPANKAFSLDVWRKPSIKKDWIPAWCIGILRFQMAIVYVYAGIAKLNPDWLLEAIPMRIWLPAKSHLPIIGHLMYEVWVAYLFSWFGAAYDLFIAFFLLNKKTRPIAYVFVLVFHVATAIFFPGIGMFPYVMIACSLIFFSADVHQTILNKLPFYKKPSTFSATQVNTVQYHFPKTLSAVLLLYIGIQLVVPFRFLLYPGHLFWHEEGYRFSWRVMLMEKSGAAFFTVKDKINHKSSVVNNAEFLTLAQEKMMSTQPDLILKYAHYLALEYQQKGFEKPAVYAEIYVSLNGQRSRLFIDSTVNLAAQKLSWQHYDWVLPYQKTP